MYQHKPFPFCYAPLLLLVGLGPACGSREQVLEERTPEDTPSELADQERPVLGDAEFRVSCGLELCEADESCCFATGACMAGNAGTCEATEVPEDFNPLRPTENDGTCNSNLDCAPTEFCHAPTCLGVGTCKSRETTECRGPIDLASGLEWDLTTLERDYLERLTMVCACDGQNWMSECAAFNAGVRVPSASGLEPCGGPPEAPTPRFENFGVAKEGVVARQCGKDGSCGPGEACCEVTHTCMPADSEQCFVPPGPGFPCLSNEDCAPMQYCVKPGCGEQGYCISPYQYSTGSCNVLEPVCGCDGVTYLNRCSAADEHQTIAAVGECPDSP